MQNTIQELLDEMIAKKDMAGINMLVLQDGQELLYAQSGYADLDSHKPFERNTIMRIYSMSKPITSVAVMILVERGMISLGEQVCKYLPGFKDQKILTQDGSVKVNRPATIRDLMSMTSGLPYGFAEGTPAEVQVQKFFDEIDAKLYTQNAYSTVDIANRLGSIGVAFQPGSTWQYGTSADVLGAIVEVVSGVSFGQFLQDEILGPLGMKDTGFWLSADKQDRLASVYERKDGSLELSETNNLGIMYRREASPAFESGGAGLHSTIDDYAIFAQMLINGGEYKGVRILSEATVNYMTHGKLTQWQQERFWRDWDSHAGYSYGCLMQHMIDPEMAYFQTWMDEYGWDGWLGSYFCNSPSNKITVLLGMQIYGPEGNGYIAEKIRNVLARFV